MHIIRVVWSGFLVLICLAPARERAKQQEMKRKRISNSFLDFRMCMILQLTMNERWGYCSTPRRARCRRCRLLFELRVQYWRWTQITSATMTTMNHIELGHGHSHYILFHSSIRYLQFAVVGCFFLFFYFSKIKIASTSSFIDRIAANVQFLIFHSAAARTHM